MTDFVGHPVYNDKIEPD